MTCSCVPRRCSPPPGQVRPGYAADLIAVDANPLADLSALRSISLVMQAGVRIR